MPGLAATLVGLSLLAAATCAALAFRQRARRQAAEARARTAEERFEMISGLAGSWLWETDPEMRLSWVSRLPSGADPGEVLGRRRDEFVGLDDDPALWQRHR